MFSILSILSSPFLISIHAPVKSTTNYYELNSWWYQNFNPRTRIGCYTEKGRDLLAYCHFNPRTREGCDKASKIHTKPLKSFQSTHSRGVRRNPTWEDVTTKVISIHALTGSATYRQKLFGPWGHQFQSTHSQGVRLGLIWNKISFDRFQSTHPRRVRLGP